ncbi:hypothetical protein LCGC14_2533150 [marine sediment metagenome]|uniref:Uncharacterized protein n=1 Tax=marine sediment metagenome TaxID=412755 RepID=A0A0F9BFX2_9ZZZZ
MMKITGKYDDNVGVKDMSKRMNEYPHVFIKACGEKLIPGTMNFIVGRRVRIKEDFRIHGIDIDEPRQDLLFEKCLLNGKPAFRIRPLNLDNGLGGHGDHILEISSAHEFTDLDSNENHEITFF